MSRGELRFCPECRQRWPRGAEFDVRSFRWLDDLPRAVSPSNIDCVIHDGAGGRNRFIVLETKRDGEEIARGQMWLLRALAGLQPERLGVRILSGDADHMTIHAVTANSVDLAGVPTTPAAVRGAIATWLGGSLWRDAESQIRVKRGTAPAVAHLHEWSKDDNGFFCVHCMKRYEAA